MESRLTVSFGKVADRERKHPSEEACGHQGALGKEAFGIRGARAPGGRVSWVFLGLFTVLGRLALGLGPIGALGLGRLAKGAEPGPMVPTMPPFFLPGRVIVLGQKKKKKEKLDRHIMGNSRPSMLLNFNVHFVTCFETALDAIRLLELILRLEAVIKG